MPYLHTPVMIDQVIACLDCRPGKVYVDGTLGGSGHALAILEKILPGGMLIGIDQDQDAIRHGEALLQPHGESIRLFHDSYLHLPSILTRLGITGVDGILLDLGVSLHHFEESGRGFSLKRDEPLDMRMNVEEAVTAEEIVNGMDEERLARLFREYGEEYRARAIARRIVQTRRRLPIRTSRQLAEIIQGVVPRKAWAGKRIHPATRVFMALRIAVNRELEVLEGFIDHVCACLNPGGRLGVLAYHSLEDRIVKHRTPKAPCGAAGDESEPEGRMRPLFRKALRPSQEEIEANPRARSARLRAFEKEPAL